MISSETNKDYILTYNEIFRLEAELCNSQIDRKGNIEQFIINHEFPSMVQVGISNKCNLNCPQCYYPVFCKKPNYQEHFMSLPTFKKIINEISLFENKPILRFLGRGEALLNPYLIEMIQYSKQLLPGKVVLISNGHLINTSMGDNLLRSGLDVLDISLDATTENTYNKVRGRNLASVEENITNLLQLKKQNNFKTKVVVSFLIQPENYKEAFDFRKKWNGVVDKVIFRAYHSYGGKIQEKCVIEEVRYPCAALWNRINIDDHGKITLCYIDWDENYVLGDINQNTLLEIWQTAYKEPRLNHVAEKYPPLCANCKTGWQAAHWGLSYEKAIE